MYHLINIIESITNNINVLDSEIFECNEFGECVADTEEFKQLLIILENFVNNYK